MKNINDKTKKRVVIAGCFAVCVVLVILIGSRFIPEKSAEQALPPQSDQSSEVTVPDTEKEKEVVVAEPNASQPGITDNGANSTGTDQTIQGDVSKPPAPSKEQLTDPSQKPNASSKPGSSTDTGSGSSPSAGGSSQSGGGLPGFDNVPNGGPNQGETVDGDGDINKQVGEM